jgi:lycopene cyclase domain-containing protein
MQLSNFAYLGVLAFIVMGTIWLEFVVGAQVLRKPLRLILAIVPVFSGLVIWDLYAISQGHWWFNEKYVTGWQIGIIPIEELLFFLIVPMASIYSFEAVRAVKQWQVGDEK